jgi:hypothetical protein
MERRAKLVEVNLLEPEPDDQPTHHDLPIADILDHATRGRVLAYRVLYGRSHLLLYSADRAGAARRVLNRGRIALGGLRRAGDRARARARVGR